MPKNEKNQGGCHTKKRKGAFFNPHFPRQCVNCYSQGNRVCCEVKRQSNHASKKWGALMEHCGRWLPFEQHIFVPKHVTLSQKMRLALLVSIPAIPAPCFFNEQAVHDKKSKGDIRGFPNWDWKISKRVTFYFWILQEDATSHKVTLFSWTFLWLLAYLGQILYMSIHNLKAGRMPYQKEKGRV